MTAKFHWTGIEELRAEFNALPVHLRDGGLTIVANSARNAGAAVRAAYPIGTAGRIYRGRPIEPGGLKRGVQVRTRPSSHQFGAAAVVETKPAYAHLFETGTTVRTTSRGANRGQMPAEHIFWPTINRMRRAAVQELIRLVERQGLRVTNAA